MKRPNIRMTHFLGLFLMACFAVTFTSCDHDTDFRGPNLVDRFGPFEIEDSLSVSAQTADFSQGDVLAFTATLNKNIDWIIKIEGLESGAVKLIEGFDRFINEENAIWDGGTTQLPFFTNETCRVTLSVPEEAAFGDTLEVTITGTKVYAGTLLTDFEDPPGQNIIVRDFQFELNIAETGRRDASVIPPAQGDYSLVLTGRDNAQDPFVGLVEIYALLAGSTYVQLPSSNPNNTYLNFFLYSDGRPHTIAIMDLVIDFNQNGTFNPGQDKIYSTGPLPVTWTGWRKFSFSLGTLDNAAIDGAFNIPEAEIDRILLSRAVLINDIANNPNNPGPPAEIQFGVDFMIFTQGAPLQL